MKSVTFITGNEHKAKYLAEYLGVEVEHIGLELDEIQSLDLLTVVRHKAREAFKKVKRPVLVEDVSLEICSLGRLPGPFIKWFLEELSEEQIIRIVDSEDRRAVGRCVFGYFDGVNEEYIEGQLHGVIASVPRGKNGFGWDRIFIPEGYSKTRAELSAEEYEAVYRTIRPLDKLKNFLES